jgi:hypothetical protein
MNVKLAGMRVVAGSHCAGRSCAAAYGCRRRKTTAIAVAEAKVRDTG